MTQSTLHTPAKHTHIFNEPLRDSKSNLTQSAAAAVSTPRSSNHFEKTHVTFDQKVIAATLTTKNNEAALHIKDAKIVLPLSSVQHQQVKQWQSEQKTISVEIRSELPAIKLSAVPSNKVTELTNPTAVKQIAVNNVFKQSDVNAVSKQDVSPVFKVNIKEAQAINLTVLQNKPSLIDHATPKVPASVLKPTPVLLQQTSDRQKLHVHVPKIDAVVEVRLPKLSPELANLLQKVPANTFALLDGALGQNKISNSQLPLQIAIDGLDTPITIKAPIAEKSASLLLNVLQQQLPSQFQIPSKIFNQWVNTSDLAQVLPVDKMQNLSAILSKTDVVHVARTQQGVTIEAVNVAKNLKLSGSPDTTNIGNNIGINKGLSSAVHLGESSHSDAHRSISIMLNKTQLSALEQANALRNPSQFYPPQLNMDQEKLGLKNILGTMKELLGSAVFKSDGIEKGGVAQALAGVTAKSTTNVQPTPNELSTQTHSMGQASLTKNKIVLNHLSLFKDLQYAGVEAKTPIIPNELNKLLHKTNDNTGLMTHSSLQLHPVTNKLVTELGQQLASDSPESDINNLLKVFAANSLVTGLENQLRAPQQTSSLLSGLTTMIQIALAQKLNTQLDTQNGLTHALKQQLKPFVPVTLVTNTGRNTTENSDSRNALVNGIAQVLKNHSQVRKINAEVKSPNHGYSVFYIAQHN